uniref:Transcriptional repressor n=1 Tax=Macrostomum lignano TaxID=282301 RepID=A0A1I8ID88_9PLAT
MLVRVRQNSRAMQASGDAPLARCPPRNNSGDQSTRSPANNHHLRRSSIVASSRRSNRATFAEYVKLRKEAKGAAGRSTSMASRNAADSLIDAKDPASVFQRQQLTTFAEYQKRGLGAAARRQNDRQSLANSDSSVLDLPEPADPVGLETADGAAVAAAVARSTAADENADRNDEDATSGDTATQGQKGCCGCCSRAKRKNADPTSRRKRRLVEHEGTSLLDEDADLADVKDMDPTITLMPYVLFESERHKVLYQSVGMDEAELLKRAIALHANDLYKQMLMRLSMSRYLKLIRERVVRTVLSKKVQFSLNNDALAVNLMGIEITAEESKSIGDSVGSSPGLSVGDITFDSQAVEMPQSRSTQLLESPDVSRQMFKPAPKLSDTEVLELLNEGKILDVTGRASLESLVSLPVTKVGQRRSS